MKKLFLTDSSGYEIKKCMPSFKTVKNKKHD